MHFYEIHSFLLVGSFESIVYFKENVKITYLDIFLFFKFILFMDAFVLQVTTYSNHMDVCTNSKFLPILWRPC